jgi:mannose-6-phosphate isomerase-like protein (cupin superfamily)
MKMRDLFLGNVFNGKKGLDNDPHDHVKGELVRKGWGSERILHNDKLCFKVMIVNPRSKCSLHYHAVKEEMFLIMHGHLTIYIVNTETGNVETNTYCKDDVVIIPPNTPHRFSTDEAKCIMVEFSTHHDDSDSYRIQPGDSQKG